jgi:hypothetical protein
MGTTARTWISTHRPASQRRAHSSHLGKPAQRHHYTTENGHGDAYRAETEA